MGNSQPVNKTNKKTTAQKLENARKLGILSLSEHGLETLPVEVFSPGMSAKLRTLDLSKNKLSSLGRLATLVEIKNLNLDFNNLSADALHCLTSLTNLQNLSVGHNVLGKFLPTTKAISMSVSQATPINFPQLPSCLRSLNLSSNSLSTIPSQLMSSYLSQLEKLDLSKNEIACVPAEIRALSRLVELNLDDNSIFSLPKEIGELKCIKVLSMRRNRLTARAGTPPIPQPLPRELFEETLLIDLNLHENLMTNKEFNEFDGVPTFLDRRQKIKSKTFSNLDVCGLK